MSKKTKSKRPLHSLQYILEISTLHISPATTDAFSSGLAAGLTPADTQRAALIHQ